MYFWLDYDSHELVKQLFFSCFDTVRIILTKTDNPALPESSSGCADRRRCTLCAYSAGWCWFWLVMSFKLSLLCSFVILGVRRHVEREQRSRPLGPDGPLHGEVLPEAHVPRAGRRHADRRRVPVHRLVRLRDIGLSRGPQAGHGHRGGQVEPLQRVRLLQRLILKKIDCLAAEEKAKHEQ